MFLNAITFRNVNWFIARQSHKFFEKCKVKITPITFILIETEEKQGIVMTMLNFTLAEKLISYGCQKLGLEKKGDLSDYHPDTYESLDPNLNSQLTRSDRSLFKPIDFNEHYDQT